MPRRDLYPRRHEIPPYVTVYEADEQIQGAVEDQHPGKEEVPAPSRGQILPAREGGPLRKGLLSRRVLATEVNEGGIGIRAVLTPVQTRMGVEDLQTTHEYEAHTHCVQP